MKKKINWQNVFKLLFLTASVVLIIHDIYVIVFKSYQWTIFGVISFMIISYVAVSIIDDFYEQTKSMPSDYKPKHASK